MLRNNSLLLTLILSTLLMSQSSMASDSTFKKKRVRFFPEAAISRFCSSIIGNHSAEFIVKYMEKLIKSARVSITKEEWNKHYAFKVYCTGNMPLFYALKWGYDDFKALADYGVDLNHFIDDHQGNVSTVKDYVKYKFRTVPKSQRLKWRKIYKIIKNKGAKGCKEQPELKCTAPYVNWVPPSKR